MPFSYTQHCVISDDAQIGQGTRIGNFVLIRDNTVIGQNCVIGSYADIEGDVRIGNFVSLQSGCLSLGASLSKTKCFAVPTS